MTEENNQAQAGDGPQFGIVRIYLKDVSFETPNSPEAFRQEFKPDIKLQLNRFTFPILTRSKYSFATS